MTNKLLCPYHQDEHPSLHLYPNGWATCFVCGVKVYMGEKNVKLAKKEPSNIKTEMEAIRSLPVLRTRGLDLPQDGKGYYIVWPSGLFYKRRNFSGPSRYQGPRGHKPPIFIYPGGGERLICVEGELNCMSVWECIKNTTINYTICSPGAAGQFPKFIDLYKTFKHVTLILDLDGPGVAYGEETKELLLKAGRRCNTIYLDRDFNDVLVQDGPEAVVELFKKEVGI